MSSLDTLQQEIFEDYIKAVRLRIIRFQNIAQPYPLRYRNRTAQSLKIKYLAHSDTATLVQDAPAFLPTNYDGVGISPGKVFPYWQMWEWARYKRIQFRDKDTGQFLSYQRTGYLIARKIWEEGSAVHRGTRNGIDIEQIIKAPLPKTAKELGEAFAKDFLSKTKKELE